jgi:hypothetical protein
LPELEGQQIFEMMEEAYAAGRVVAAADRRVLVDRDGDGRLEEGFFTYTFVPTFSGDGQPRGLVVHSVETTEQAMRAAAAERAAAASRQRLQQASEVVLELQRSLLPGGLPMLPRLSLAAQYRVAGDWLSAVVVLVAHCWDRLATSCSPRPRPACASNGWSTGSAAHSS